MCLLCVCIPIRNLFYGSAGQLISDVLTISPDVTMPALHHAVLY